MSSARRWIVCGGFEAKRDRKVDLMEFRWCWRGSGREEPCEDWGWESGIRSVVVDCCDDGSGWVEVWRVVDGVVVGTVGLADCC